jgi:hypothetical protein
VGFVCKTLLDWSYFDSPYTSHTIIVSIVENFRYGGELQKSDGNFFLHEKIVRLLTYKSITIKIKALK